MSMQDTQKTLTNYSLNVCAVPTYILEAFYLTFMYLKPCSYETVHKQGVSRCGQLYLFFKFMPKLTYFRKMFRSLIFCTKFSLRLFICAKFPLPIFATPQFTVITVNEMDRLMQLFTPVFHESNAFIHLIF